MTFSGLMVAPGTILRAPLVEDRNNNLMPDWDNASETAVCGWSNQTAESEVLTDRDAQVSEWIYFVPAGTDITALDRVRLAEGTFEVMGPPNRASTPRREHHVEVKLRLVEG